MQLISKPLRLLKNNNEVINTNARAISLFYYVVVYAVSGSEYDKISTARRLRRCGKNLKLLTKVL